MKENTAVIDYPNFAEQSRKTGFRKETKIIFREEDETTVLQTLQDFGDASTVHGLSYILNKEQNIICRFFWLVIVILSAVLATFW